MYLQDTTYEDYFPPRHYWGNISESLWESLRFRHEDRHGLYWNFKEEAIKYCLIDCICLHEIIVKFNDLVYKEFKLNYP